MFLPKLKQSSAYQGLESIKHNLISRLFKCFQLIRNHKSRDYYIQKVKVTEIIFVEFDVNFQNSTLHNQHEVGLPRNSVNS